MRLRPRIKLAKDWQSKRPLSTLTLTPEERLTIQSPSQERRASLLKAQSSPRMFKGQQSISIKIRKESLCQRYPQGGRLQRFYQSIETGVPGLRRNVPDVKKEDSGGGRTTVSRPSNSRKGTGRSVGARPNNR
jgi:hypothetical protein